MSRNPLFDEYMTHLLAGNRAACREFIARQLTQTEDATRLYEDLLWPAMERIEHLFRHDRVNVAVEHMATRICRSIADQVQLHLRRPVPNGRRMVISCADGEPEELGAQMTADLFESRGWEVYFLGSGVPNDEVLNLLGQLRPDLLLVFGTQPGGVPGIRALTDLIREIGVNSTMNIMVSGGVFNRADGLWREVNADLFARTAIDAMRLAEESEPRTADARASTGTRKRRRRRATALAEAST